MLTGIVRKAIFTEHPPSGLFGRTANDTRRMSAAKVGLNNDRALEPGQPRTRHTGASFSL